MGRGNHEEIRDGLVDRRRGPERVEEPTRKHATGRGTHSEVRDGSGDPWGGAGRFDDYRGGPGRVEGPTLKSGTGR